MRRCSGGSKEIGREVRDCLCQLWGWRLADEDADHTEVVSVAVMEWQIEEGKEKEVLDFYKSEAAPTIASSPDTLRFRLLEIKNATVLQADSYKTLEKKKLHKYLTIAELASEEWPWDVVVKLGEKPQWIEYFEGQNIVVSFICRMLAGTVIDII